MLSTLSSTPLEAIASAIASDAQRGPLWFQLYFQGDRARTLALGPNAGAAERGTILALLGSVERAEILIRRIDDERKSVNRQTILARAAARRENRDRSVDTGGLSPVPAE